MSQKYIYSWGDGRAEGSASMKRELGGKGANLAEMSTIGAPVPPGFTISTDVCAYYYEHRHRLPSTLESELEEHILRLESCRGAKFGDPSNPLLVSVRSGAEISMPGMMDTILNLGMNDDVVLGVAKKTNNPHMAWDSYRRFISMFGDVVRGVPYEKFEERLTAVKSAHGRKYDTELSVEELQEVVGEFKKVYRDHAKSDFPMDPQDQLHQAILAVIQSWMSPRAEVYRAKEKIFGLKGTAVNVQSMVFGNMGDTSGTGVAFTRDPATGENEFFGEFLVDAQGEDVVAGIRTPLHICDMKELWREIYDELDSIRIKLESHYGDMQDIEFTVEEGKLYMLQTRTGKRTGRAAVKIAWDMVQEGIISKEDALLRIEGDHLNQLLFPVIDPIAKRKAVQDGAFFVKGLPAGPGAASGVIVFSAEDAIKESKAGKRVVLLRHETSPEDVSGMAVAEAVVTSTGGMTSHAAVVARGWGKCCVVGAGALEISYKNRSVTVRERSLSEGDWVSVDGTTGEVFVGDMELAHSPVVAGLVDGEREAADSDICRMFNDVMAWADEKRRLKVRTNADSPQDASVSRLLGAEGIGLCRTEHMFFEGERVWAVREMILAEDADGRERALAKLIDHQRDDFTGIFRVMGGLSVNIRLLDPPLHEFLPKESDGVDEMARRLGLSRERVETKISVLTEMNPMLGHRGCRLSISYPEICRMQVRAILEAACVVQSENIEVRPEIMIPLIGTVQEFKWLKAVVDETARAVFKEKGVSVEYQVGTMIEIPRAALTADKIAAGGAEFFSFGTNDLTQMTFGYSRDDIGSFLPNYLEQKVLQEDPFSSIDVEGVGALVKTAVDRGRSETALLKCGICGEHGGDPRSIKFFHSVGLDYVSCSPYRVPIARLAAAQAVVLEERL